MKKNKVIRVQEIDVTVAIGEREDYICISDLAKAKGAGARAADVIKNWLRNRNTLEFLGAWESIFNPDFKVVEFDHFKKDAGLHSFVLSVSEWIEETNAIGLYVKRGNMEELLRIRILLLNLQWLTYAEEADVLNVALFGFTAKAWREVNPELAKKSNVRDYATINELTVLSNMETHNAQMIREGKSKEERFFILQDIAGYQLKILNAAESISGKFLPEGL